MQCVNSLCTKKNICEHYDADAAKKYQRHPYYQHMYYKKTRCKAFDRKKFKKQEKGLDYGKRR